VLKDERFQNWCMDKIRRIAKEDPKRLKWLDTTCALLVYGITDRGSQLRKFISDVLARNSPFLGEDV